MPSPEIRLRVGIDDWHVQDEEGQLYLLARALPEDPELLLRADTSSEPDLKKYGVDTLHTDGLRRIGEICASDEARPALGAQDLEIYSAMARAAGILVSGGVSFRASEGTHRLERLAYPVIAISQFPSGVVSADYRRNSVVTVQSVRSSLYVPIDSNKLSNVGRGQFEPTTLVY